VRYFLSLFTRFRQFIARITRGIWGCFYLSLLSACFVFGLLSAGGKFWLVGIPFIFISGIAAIGFVRRLTTYQRFPHPSLSHPTQKDGKMNKAGNAEMSTAGDPAKRYRDKTIEHATQIGLADGVFKIVCYNLEHSHRMPVMRIDPFEVFASEPRELISEWIARSEKLLTSNYPVGDALAGKSEDYEEIVNRYIKSNPGFSQNTYAHAIHLGASKAVY
jgi:hypothetical protein